MRIGQMTDPEEIKALMTRYADDVVRSTHFAMIRLKCNSFRFGWLRLIELIGEQEAADFVNSIDKEMR